MQKISFIFMITMMVIGFLTMTVMLIEGGL